MIAHAWARDMRQHGAQLVAFFTLDTARYTAAARLFGISTM